MACAAVVFDIDGTLLPYHNKTALESIVSTAEFAGADVWINTARPQRYCNNPWRTPFVPKEKHRCMLQNCSVPESKLQNMKHTGVKDNRCVILVDDIENNIQAVRDGGFMNSFKVDPDMGVQMDTSAAVNNVILSCCRPSDSESESTVSSEQ